MLNSGSRKGLLGPGERAFSGTIFFPPLGGSPWAQQKFSR